MCFSFSTIAYRWSQTITENINSQKVPTLHEKVQFPFRVIGVEYTFRKILGRVRLALNLHIARRETRVLFIHTIFRFSQEIFFFLFLSFYPILLSIFFPFVLLYFPFSYNRSKLFATTDQPRECIILYPSFRILKVF